MIASAPTLARFPAPLALTGVGLVTSVGRTARAACAAIRAGISRPAPLRTFPVLDLDAAATEPVKAHAMAGYTDGFSLAGRWLRLARGAVEDLERSGALPPMSDGGAWARTVLLAVGPYPDDARYQAMRRDGLDVLRRDCLPGLVEGTGLPIPAGHREAIGLGHAGVTAALHAAAAAIAGGGFERALIVAADSLLEPAVLDRLATQGRLKSGDAPTGLMPGEAGAALLLEQPAAARRRRARRLAAVRAVAQCREPGHLLSDAPNTGQGLAASLRGVLDGRSASPPFAAAVVADLNGESWRAMEWGVAQVRLGPRLRADDLRVPAMSLGDTGAASGGVSVVFGAHLFSRGLAREALVLSSSERGETGCIGMHIEDDADPEGA